MELALLTFATLLQRMAASVQGAATTLVDLSIGSVLRACMEASASIALWMQWLILQVLAMTRAATSNGSDLDSWVADFSLQRLPGSQATGTVTFARYSAGLPAFIALGVLVRTTDGTQTFGVVQDVNNPAWNGSDGYVIGALSANVDVPVEALSFGLAGNVLAGAIGLLATPIVGIDTAQNQQALTGGAEQETDSALRSRFTGYINTRSLATTGALMTAAQSVRQGLRLAVLENQDRSGAAQIGNFIVVADDGSGFPPAILISQVAAAIEIVRPIGSTYSVTGPVVEMVSVNITIETAGGSNSAIGSAIRLAVLAWIQQLSIGGVLSISKIEAIAHGIDGSVLSVSQTTINLGSTDVAAPSNGVLVPLTITVS